MYRITKEQEEKLRKVDTYLTNEEEARILGISKNTIIKLRKELNLETRKLGRPYGALYTTIDIPKEIQRNIDMLKDITEQLKKR